MPRRRGLRRGLVVLGVLLVLGAGVLAYLLRDRPPDVDRRDAPTIESANTMATGGVEKSIRDRLEARYGRAVVADCPKRVDMLKGTEFTCDVFFEDDPSVTTVATVRITGGGGKFEWSTEDAAP